MGAYFNSENDNNSILYYAIAYYRLPKDDGSRSESDSILNQRKLVRNYISSHDNIILVDEAYDDGYTGTNYDRPGFMTVMDAVNAGKVNCVIVKDLSRLGSEYIETGKYLEMVFPEKGIRFIAINDDFDSDHSRSGDDIIIPVKNIMNEAYCRELSKKLRKQFKIQRSNGEFLGAFACYGYLKDPDDKHKLIIDEYAAEVVKIIFAMKLQGSSPADIAVFLNHEGILPPSEYKKSRGLNYKSGLKSAENSKWSHMTIRNILANPVYKGDLVQGKRGTPNYKLKKMRYRKTEEWVTVIQNHEPIVEACMFDLVQRMLERDTRKSPLENTVQPLAGLLFCGDCKRGMCRRSVSRNNKKFFYYVCSNNKKSNECSSHSFEQGKLEKTVLRAIQKQINLVVEIDELLGDINGSTVMIRKLQGLDLRIAEKMKEIDSYQDFRMKLYESLASEVLDRDEYDFMRQKYTGMIQTAREALENLQKEREEILKETTVDRTWIEQFIRYKNITELSREVVVTLIDKIYIFEDKRIQIKFNYSDEFALFQELLKQSEREVV